MKDRMTPIRAICALLALTLIMGGGNLWASWTEVHNQARSYQHEQQQEQAAGAALSRKLCSTFGTLAALHPPEGNPKTNPSRAYEQEEHAALVQLGTDLGCKAPAN
jgi:hypothetical protein